MSVLVISKNGDFYSFATKLVDAGHNVTFWVKDPKAQDTGKGRNNPKRVTSYHPYIRSADLILFDMVGLGNIATRLDEGGRVVLGGGIVNDKLELDRAYGQRVAQSLTKVKVPEYHEFTSILEGIRFVQKSDKLWVFKPSANQPVFLTFVAKDTNDGLISFMRSLPYKSLKYILQEKVEGIEISTEGWFDGEDFVCFNHTIEHKRLMEGDKGPQTGCMGNIVWVCKEDTLVQTVLSPLKEFLRKARYIGPLDANCIVTPKNVYFLEWTARFGYDAFQALCELLRVPLFDFLYGVATRTMKKVQFSNEFSIAVRLSLPPYPAETDYSHLAGLKVLDIPKEAFKHVYLSDVAWKDGIPYIAGIDGVVGCVTARGVDVRECGRRVYRTIENISLTQDLQYRTDLTRGFEESLKNLVEWNWLEKGDANTQS